MPSFRITCVSSVSLLAVMLAAPTAHAQTVKLFPAEQTSRVMSSGAPEALPALQSPAEINGGTTSDGPLKVVIPNIQKAKKAKAAGADDDVAKAQPIQFPARLPIKTAAEPAEQAQQKPEAPQAPVAQAAAAPVDLIIPESGNEIVQVPAAITTAAQPTAQPVQTVVAPTAPAAQQEAGAKPSGISAWSQSLYNDAQDLFSNGVVLPEWSNIPIVRHLVKPRIQFAALPNDWLSSIEPVSQVLVASANDAHAVAALAPAAGEPEKPLLEPTTPSAQVTLPDATEPAPALSEQSKAIADKVAPVPDKPAVSQKPKKVADIDHSTEKPEGLGGGSVSVAGKETMGLKMKNKRPKVDPSYELERAYNALLAGKSDDAIQIYEDILTGDPKNKDALFGLASTYHRVGQLDMARTLYGKLLELEPKHRDGLNNFLVLLSDEAPQEALSQMEKLEQQNPGFSPIPAQMAIIYQKLGDQDKAVDKMYRALAISPENITYRYNLAIMLDKNKKYDEAGKLYAQLLDSDAKGEKIPGDAKKIQQRLTFIRSNSSNR